MISPRHIDAEAIARRINPSARRSSSGWWPLPGICHDRRDRPHLGVRDNSGRDGSNVVSVKCWVGCDRDSIRRAIEGATGWRIWGLGRDDSPARSRTETTRDRRRSRADPREYARKLWGATSRIERDESHPARRWITRRGLYWPSPIPLPHGIRWLPSGLFHPKHQGAGAIVAAFAPPDHWEAAWPGTPIPTGVELVHLDSEGFPALDRPESERGLEKRSFGIRQGALCLLGEPGPDRGVGLILVEGLADALALASRYPETVASVGGISGMQPDLLAAWLSRWSSVTLYADDDTDGIEGARRLRRGLVRHDLELRVYRLGGSHNDPADFAEDNPLDDVDLDLAREFAADLEQEGLPRWEAARLAMMTVGSPAADTRTEQPVSH